MQNFLHLLDNGKKHQLARTLSFTKEDQPTRLLSYIEVGELLLQVIDFWRVVENDIGLVGMESSIVLMIGLGGIETLQMYDLRDDAMRKDLGLINLRNVRIGDAFLLVVGIEDGGAILCAFVRPLPIELGGVVSYGKEDAEQFTVSNL